jgi:hypothetical protein
MSVTAVVAEDHVVRIGYREYSGCICFLSYIDVSRTNQFTIAKLCQYAFFESADEQEGSVKGVVVDHDGNIILLLPIRKTSQMLQIGIVKKRDFST